MIWYKDGEQSGKQVELRADADADVARLPQFAEDHDLKPGSTCLVIGSSSVYMMDSTGTWRQL